MTDQKKIDNLIKMLDASMTSGTGHINVVVNDEEDITLEEISVEKGMDCSMGDTACMVPNILIDDEKV